MEKYLISLSLVLGSIFTACNTNTNTDDGYYANSKADSSPSLVLGYFIDAPVEGLSYTCSSGLSGITQANGGFTCNQGDSVTFKLGTLTLGTALVESVITPFHLNKVDTEKVYNISQLLHSLDNDSNPDNGILLVTGLALDGVYIGDDSSSFQNALASVLASVSKTNYDRDLAKAKMLGYIVTHSNGTNYGLSIDIDKEFASHEALMCSNMEKLVNGICTEKNIPAPIPTTSTTNIEDDETYISGEETAGSIDLNRCTPCHGSNFEKEALGKSKIVANMTKSDVSNALIGYKYGTYGSTMKGLMKGQVARYSDYQLRNTGLGRDN